MENNIVKVKLWGQEVGLLYWDKKSHKAIFEYNPAFVRKGIDIAPLTSSIHSIAGRQPIPGNTDKIYQGLPPFIADSLPDKWGNRVFEHWAKMRGIKSSDITPVDKLSFIGSRGMGALEFEPAMSIQDDAQDIQIQDLYALAQRIFDERSEVSVLPEESITMQRLYAVGTSAGGQHPKAILAIHAKTGEIRSGQLDWSQEYKYYILKFAESSTFPHTQVEMAYYQMATNMGINMMPSQLKEIDGQYHFLTERYDRQNGERIHTQTLAAMSETACSYEDLMTVARKLDIPQTEQEQLYKRMVMNILGGNVDDHTKNFSFMLPKGGQWHITPAYDMTFTVDLAAMQYVNYHNLSVRGKVTNILEEDLLAFAKDNSIKNAARIIDQVANVLSNCWTYLIEAGVSRYWADKIEAYIAELLPERYQKTMLHSLPTKVSEYITNNGVCIRDIVLRETRNGDLILSAFSEQEEKRWLINKKSSTFKDIKEKGWIHVEEKELIHLVETYLRLK